MNFCYLANQFGSIFEELIKNTAIYWIMYHHQFTEVAVVNTYFLYCHCQLYLNLYQIYDSLVQTGLSVVDCTASPETVHILNKVIDFGCCIILANKKPLTRKIVSSIFAYSCNFILSLIDDSHHGMRYLMSMHYFRRIMTS